MSNARTQYSNMVGSMIKAHCTGYVRMTEAMNGYIKNGNTPYIMQAAKLLSGCANR